MKLKFWMKIKYLGRTSKEQRSYAGMFPEISIIVRYCGTMPIQDAQTSFMRGVRGIPVSVHGGEREKVHWEVSAARERHR